MHCLQDLVSQEYGKEINFSYEMEENDIVHANIIVLILFPGEKYTCRPELKNWRPGLLILFCKVPSKDAGGLPDCFEHSVMLCLDDSLESVSTMIKKKLGLALVSLQDFTANCKLCRARNISQQQRKIIDGLLCGFSTEQIACQMNLAPKTVYEHKYSLMRRFELRSVHELMVFYKSQRDKYPLNIRHDAKGATTVQEEILF